MDVLGALGKTGLVPVVVVDGARDALLTAQALLEGEIDVMEIAMRTDAALDAIDTVSKECGEICVGAGTVLNVIQAKEAVDAGVRFIVSPGYDEELVDWCIQNGIPVVPGCVTPSEIMAALRQGLNVLKFFPSNIYGGLSAMKALTGPFASIKFIPTGGITNKNLSEYISAPFVYAAGGSWLCSKEDISAGNFEKITENCREARRIVLAYR
jgi:2-dehydro-3-deoxyphosphogluconate aldolase/(4S)-4-hydroxy-2-oxoglutarate aldolase